MSAPGPAPAPGAPPAEPATTLHDLYVETAGALGDRPAARWLLEVAAGRDGDELTAAFDQPATERVVAHLDAMLRRHREGEPLQYVLGRWGFRRLDLAIDRRVLIPRPETELVAAAAIDIAAARHRATGAVRVADLGTGSGAIGLAVADELPLSGVTVWLTDVSEAALDVARANLAGLGRKAANVRVAPGWWFDALPPDVAFDVIVSNPPYVAEGSTDVDASVTAWEPAAALFAGTDGLDALRTLAAGAPARLGTGGALVLEIGADQGAAVRALLGEHGFVDVEIRADLAGRDRIAIGVRPGP